MYKTTSSDYGARSPTFESSPCSYHPISQTFSQHLGFSVEIAITEEIVFLSLLGTENHDHNTTIRNVKLGEPG
ncbi:hypothetical protein QQF64_012753 [Cirrhinus molitorella]|uniref:Uncharacterized protein n=1 Tax=Cirrhinus molitorella TaxID=172907 RepID=A0ABR3M0H7_9TELE